MLFLACRNNINNDLAIERENYLHHNLHSYAIYATTGKSIPALTQKAADCIHTKSIRTRNTWVVNLTFINI